MEKYTYLLLSISVVACAVGALIRRKDLWSLAGKVGFLGGVAGLLSELVYFRDYWRPLSTSGVARLSIEDVLFGAGITILGVVVYPVLARKNFASQKGVLRHKKLYGIFFTGAVLALVGGSVGFGINSIFISMAIFIVCSIIILCLRKDLLLPAIFSVLTVLPIILLIYLILFDVVSPTFWDDYWLLAESRWGITILGNIPLTEILWYASWILFAGCSYPFVSGKVFADNKPKLRANL